MNTVWADGLLAAKLDELTLKAAAKLAFPQPRTGTDVCPDCDDPTTCVCTIADWQHYLKTVRNAQYPMTHAEQLAAALDVR